MLCIQNASTDPFFNLAVDEYLLKNRSEDLLVLSVNSPSVIIGKHQVAHREADTHFVTINRIPVIRRVSGGGAVYHDSGNLNFSFILQSLPGKQVDFRKYMQPVIDFLSSVGIPAEFGGKNDIKVKGLKISGNAEHIFRNRVLHHGTLLFSSHLTDLRNALRKDTSSYFTRAVNSNPAEVANIDTLTGRFQNIEEFRGLMMDYFSSQTGNETTELTSTEISEISDLAKSKYENWEWNYAYGPQYSIVKNFTINKIPHTLSLKVKDGVIVEAEAEGSELFITFSEKISGCKHMPEDLMKRKMDENINLPIPVTTLLF